MAAAEATQISNAVPRNPALLRDTLTFSYRQKGAIALVRPPVGRFVRVIRHVYGFRRVFFAARLAESPPRKKGAIPLVRPPVGRFVRFIRHVYGFRRVFFAARMLLGAACFPPPGLAFFSSRKFHAVRSAPASKSSFAAASRIWVIPILPQPPAMGTNTSGASSTNAACCSSPSIRFPYPWRWEARVAKILPPTRKSGAPMCELSSAPGRLRAIRRKSCASIDRSLLEQLDWLPFGGLTAEQKGFRNRPPGLGDDH